MNAQSIKIEMKEMVRMILSEIEERRRRGI
jgi:hypothetical protein